MSFQAVQKKIEAKEGVSKESAGAILASASRNASPAAKKANPNLMHVKGKVGAGEHVCTKCGAIYKGNKCPKCGKPYSMHEAYNEAGESKKEEASESKSFEAKEKKAGVEK